MKKLFFSLPFQSFCQSHQQYATSLLSPVSGEKMWVLFLLLLLKISLHVYMKNTTLLCNACNISSLCDFKKYRWVSLYMSMACYFLTQFHLKMLNLLLGKETITHSLWGSSVFDVVWKETPNLAHIALRSSVYTELQPTIPSFHNS